MYTQLYKNTVVWQDFAVTCCNMHCRKVQCFKIMYFLLINCWHNLGTTNLRQPRLQTALIFSMGALCWQCVIQVTLCLNLNQL